MIDPAFLLDTNVLIYILEGQPLLVRERLQRLRVGEAVTSAVAYAELALGSWNGKTPPLVLVDRLTNYIPILSFDEPAARQYAKLPFRRGRFDRLIAVHALARNLTLVTNNEADFADIPGLKVENWTLPL